MLEACHDHEVMVIEVIGVIFKELVVAKVMMAKEVVVIWPRSTKIIIINVIVREMMVTVVAVTYLKRKISRPQT